MTDKEKRRRKLLGLKIQYHRKAIGWNCEQLAEAIDKSVSLVWKIESQYAPVSLSTLWDIADALNVPVISLLDE